jgi:recombination protein RecR
VCEICADPARETGLLCVVERATDILPLERTRVFKGLYHALGGRIAPLDHIGPGDLRIAELVERVRQEKPDEIILALGADVEGEATASYISDLLKGSGARITRIAQGLPAGGGLDHADDLTLVRALSGRRVFGGS